MTYNPTPGWFDLTIRPKGMNATTHKKIQDQQMIIIGEAKKFQNREVRKNNQFAYDNLRDKSAELQQIVLKNWPHKILFGNGCE